MSRLSAKTIATLAVLLLAALDATGAARPAPSRTAKERAKFLQQARHAGIVAVGTVTGATVERILNVRRSERGKHAWTEKLGVQPTGILYGTDRPKQLNVKVSAVPPRSATKPAPRYKKGDPVIALVIRRPRWNHSAAIRWSRAAEAAVLEALAPGWARHGGRSFLCPWCARRDFPADVGTCGVCKGRTSSGVKKLCATCARLRGQCQACDRKAGPPTLGVSLWLKTLSPKRGQRDPMTISIAPGSAPELWVWVESTAKSVPELPCWKNKLNTCPTLFFLVSGPGINGKKVAFFERSIPKMKRLTLPKPLTGSPFAELKLEQKPFARRGTYTVQAVAGRLVSNPVTVVVKDLGAGVRPQPGAFPAAAQVNGNTISCVRDGKILWRARLQFDVGQVREEGGLWIITSADGSSEATLHAATGKMIRTRKFGPRR